MRYEKRARGREGERERGRERGRVRGRERKGEEGRGREALLVYWCIDWCTASVH
jgi:hypothetical protein